VGFFGFSGAGAIFGTAVMARWAGRRDRDKPGFSMRWPTAALGQHAVSGGGPSDGGRCRRDSRHARRGREREGKMIGIPGRRSSSAEGFYHKRVI
jgi:hypothetical protein